MKHYRQACMGLFISGALLTFALPTVYAEPVTLTLPDCVQLALKNNPKIQIAQADKEKAAWVVKEANAHHGLSLDYNYMLGRTDQPPSWYNNTTAKYPLALAYNPLSHENTPFAIPYPAWDTTYTFYQHQLKLQVPLYTGGKIENSILLAKHASAATD
ncbi:MAG: TolC family protein, partial [Pelosinus sp.]|nr:TolC family protein [Pelosinus sp.]